MHVSRFLLSALLAGCPFVLSAGCKDTDKDKVIELGHIYAVTQNDDEFRATELAKDEISADPARLPLGRQIRIRHAPGGSKPEEWEGQAARLMAFNHVAGLVCGGRAHDAEKIGTAVQGDGVIAISTADWSVTPSQNLFTVGLAPAERGRALAQFAKDKKPKTVLVVRDPLARAANVAADHFLAELSATGIRPTEVDVSSTDRPMADAVFFACSARSALQHRPKTALRLFGDDPAELLVAGPEADGFVVASAYHAGVSNERMTAFAEKFQKAYSRAPSRAAVFAYDTVTVWAEAARRANKLDSAAIRGELLKRDQPFNTLTGTLLFADDHTARRPIFVGPIAEGHLKDVKEIAAGPAS